MRAEGSEFSLYLSNPRGLTQKEKVKVMSLCRIEFSFSFISSWEIACCCFISLFLLQSVYKLLLSSPPPIPWSNFCDESRKTQFPTFSVLHNKGRKSINFQTFPLFLRQIERGGKLSALLILPFFPGKQLWVRQKIFPSRHLRKIRDLVGGRNSLFPFLYSFHILGKCSNR